MQIEQQNGQRVAATSQPWLLNLLRSVPQKSLEGIFDNSVLKEKIFVRKSSKGVRAHIARVFAYACTSQ
jgi:hypothetical protein